MQFTVNWSEPKKFQADNFSEINFDGIYMIGYRKEGTNGRHPVYFGQGYISTRLVNHFENNAKVLAKIRANGIGYYRFAKCSNESDRLDIELGLYRKYGGKEKLCNEIDPPGTDRYSEVSVIEVYP